MAILPVTEDTALHPRMLQIASIYSQFSVRRIKYCNPSVMRNCKRTVHNICEKCFVLFPTKLENEGICAGAVNIPTLVALLKAH